MVLTAAVGLRTQPSPGPWTAALLAALRHALWPGNSRLALPAHSINLNAIVSALKRSAALKLGRAAGLTLGWDLEGRPRWGLLLDTDRSALRWRPAGRGSGQAAGAAAAGTKDRLLNKLKRRFLLYPGAILGIVLTAFHTAHAHTTCSLLVLQRRLCTAWAVENASPQCE